MIFINPDLVIIHTFSLHAWPFAFMLQVTWIENIIRTSLHFICSCFAKGGLIRYLANLHWGWARSWQMQFFVLFNPGVAVPSHA